jgi:hypothetical protein
LFTFAAVCEAAASFFLSPHPASATVAANNASPISRTDEAGKQIA